MRQLRFLLTLLFLSLSLTACSVVADLLGIEDGTNGDKGDKGDTGSGAIPDTEFTHSVRNLNSTATGSATPANPDIPTDSDDARPYQSFTALADANTANNVTLQGFAVLLNDTHIYKRTDSSIDWDKGNNAKGLKINNQMQLSRIISPTFTSTNAPAVAFSIKSDGTLTAVTAYGDKAYSDNLTVDRSAIFGYDNASTYMAYVSWSESQAADFTDTIPTATELDGIMLVGFETQDADLPTITTDLTFTGKGKGVYSVFGADSLAINYNTSFTAKAIVNFTNQTADFSTTDTVCSDCNNLNLTKLDLSTGNSTFTDNNISTDILAGSLAGKFDARFYGANAWEFGGTFALNDADSIYYGAFGGQREGIDLSAERAFDDSSIDKTIDANIDMAVKTAIGNDNNANIEEAHPSDTINMNALAVYGDSRTDYARTANIETLAKGDITPSNSITRLSGAAASITFVGGTIMVVNLYLDDGKIYTATDTGNVSANTLSENIDKGGNGAPDTATTAKLNLRRGSQADNDVFGYSSKHIAYIDWNISKSGTDLTATNTNLIDADYDIAGMMMAGVETADGAIIDAGKTIFTGKGRGYVRFNDENQTLKGVTFTINANIDFSKKEVTFASTASKLCSDATFSSCTAGSSPYNFQTVKPILYSVNNISGAITNSDGDTDGLTGMADARFYGTGDDASTEFAGSFAMSDTANNHYYGVFGSEIGDNYIISDEIQTGTTVTKPAENDKTLTGFNDTMANRANKTDITLPVASIVQITSNDDDMIINEKISGGVTLFDYDNDGDFAGAGLTLYFDDKKYEVTAGTGGADSIASSSVEVNGVADTSVILNLDRDAFGFTAANYMAVIDWNVAGSDYDSYGFGMTGFETAGADIPKVSNAHFAGEGHGRYEVNDDNYFSTFFNITANVDFFNRKVMLESSDTCSAPLDANKLCANLEKYYLNFTGTLNYDSADNNLTGAVTTTGDTDNAQLSGTADARFYGPAAEELGGTFSMSNHDAGYVGYFGVKK
ncbi:MAG: transferrin-binding protein-like solute binding protein [Alphaproteobacteria bacterium]|nr:transferrin-binding protein-like solute binding protein [Alphaproteobacteria bacterium]